MRVISAAASARLVEIERAATALEPDVLLLDEPMAGASGTGQAIGDTLVELYEGLTILMAEQELAIMEERPRPGDRDVAQARCSQRERCQLRERTEVVEAYLVG